MGLKIPIICHNFSQLALIALNAKWRSDDDVKEKKFWEWLP
jgi:hypothetical protein